MPRAIRSSATLPFTDSVRIFSAAADGGFGGGGAHVGDRLRFGLRDLGLGHLGAARDELFHLGLGFGGDPLGLGLGALDDAGGLGLGLALLALIFGEQLLRLFLQAARFVELGLDALGALVERVESASSARRHRPECRRRSRRRRRPRIRLRANMAGPQRLSASSTAAATAGAGGAVPISRSTIAPAASTAMPRTFAMAAVLVAAICFSASASCVLSLASSALRRSSASACSLSRISVPIACARLRASASDFS